jgi:hypothetical protein
MDSRTNATGGGRQIPTVGAEDGVELAARRLLRTFPAGLRGSWGTKDTSVGTLYHDAVRAVIGEIRGRTPPAFEDELATMALLDMLNGVREWFRPTGPMTIDEIADHRYIEMIDNLLQVDWHGGVTR